MDQLHTVLPNSPEERANSPFPVGAARIKLPTLGAQWARVFQELEAQKGEPNHTIRAGPLVREHGPERGRRSQFSQTGEQDIKVKGRDGESITTGEDMGEG